MQNKPQAQSATAFHFLISKRLGFFEEEEATAEDEEGPGRLDASLAGTIVTSESIDVYGRREIWLGQESKETN